MGPLPALMEVFKGSGPVSDPFSLDILNAEVTASASGSSLSTRPRSPRRVHRRSFLRTSFAVFSLSLALAYLLWGCFRHLSVASKKDGTIRALATGGSKSGECLKDEGSSAGGTQFGQGEADFGASGGEAQDRRDGSRSSEHQGRSMDDEPAEGWGPRRMPSDWVARTQTTLVGWKSLSSICLKLLDVLSPPQSVMLVASMASLVAVELSGFGYIPHRSQRFRWDAGTGFVSLIEKVFFTRALRRAMEELNLGKNLRKTRALIRQVIRIPPEDELMSQRKAKSKLTRHWRLSTDALHHVEFHLALLLPESQQARSPGQTDMVLKVIQAVGDVRTKHILGDSMLRRWLGTCHKEVRANLYTREDFEAGNAAPDLGETAQQAQIVAAIVGAGGGVEVSVSPTHSQPCGSTSSTEALEQPSFSHTGDPVGPQPEHRPNSPEGGSSPGLSPHETPESVLYKTHAPSFADSLKLSCAIQMRQSLEDSGSIVDSQGRHEQRSLQIASAEALGWGPGVMPLAATAQLNILTMRLQKMANCCLWLLNLVSPEVAVKLALSVTKLVAVESAGLSWAPPEIQRGRRSVRQVYTLLLQTLREKENLQEAAGRLGVKETIVPLQRLFEEVSRGPTASSWSTEEYLVFMVNCWRLCNLSTQQAVRVLNALIPTKFKRVRPHQVHRAVAIAEALFRVRKKQLLSDPRVSQWLESCQRKVQPGMLFTQRELDEAGRAGKKLVGLLLEEISKAIQDVTNPYHPAGTSGQRPPREAQGSATGARMVPRRKISDESQQRAGAAASSERPPVPTSPRTRRFTVPTPPPGQYHKPQPSYSSAALPSAKHEEGGGLGKKPAPALLTEVARVVRKVTSPSWPSRTSRPPPAAVHPLVSDNPETLHTRVVSEGPSKPPTAFDAPELPPIARESRPQPVIDPTIRRRHQIAQRYPSAPPSPAPVVQLPEVYYQVFPPMYYQTFDFRTRASSGEHVNPDVYPSPTMHPPSAHGPLSPHPLQSLHLPTWGPFRAAPEGFLQSSKEAREAMSHAPDSFPPETSRQPEGAVGGYGMTRVLEQFASWSAFSEEDKPDE